MSSNPNTKKSNNSNSKKKRKLSPEEETQLRRSEATTLKKYIVRCTDVPSDCPAIRAALSGVDEEMKRIDRDEKLRLKFSGGVSTSATTTTARANVAGTKGVDEEDMEWQDVACDDVDTPPRGKREEEEEVDLTASVQLVPPETPPTRDSSLGRKLATLSIASVAEAGTTISHPLAAIAIAIHASLISDVVGFRCTGIPEDDKGPKGFAKPIRELPRDVFLPNKWDSNACGWNGFTDVTTIDSCSAQVLLRYRKDGVGSVVLSVVLCEDAATATSSPPVRVRFGPAGKSDEGKGPPDFPIGEHVNLDGLVAALSRNGKSGVPPALHYRALSTLLTNFADAVDLGVIKEEDENEMIMEEGVNIAAGDISRSTVVVPPVVSVDPLRVGPTPVPVQPGRWSGQYDDGRHPRIEDFDSSPLYPGGDFAGDLAPGGILDPRIRPGGGSGIGPGGGNLMGPTHPAFRGGGGINPNDFDDGGLSNIPGGGPGLGRIGMAPRFDPVYPPGSPADPNGIGGVGRGRGRGRGRGGRRGLGDPNPDHQRPPSNFGNDMFM
mmetsp:Transcript_37653/g.55153  ORF Transcript_37653/g.55153 Transcript_37653/m.55153 type:complete len:549 (+) Transcript_37653:152-1798(+)